jgi:pilus assembly protein CpaC
MMAGTVFLLGFLCTGVVAAEAVQNFIVYVDESIPLNLDYQFSEYALGNPEVADVVVRKVGHNRSELIINGKEEGKTNLIFWDGSGGKRAEYEIEVKKRDMNQLLAEVKEILGEAEGLQIGILGKKIVIRGEALAPGVMAKANKLAKDNPHVINTARLSSSALKVLVKIINSFLGSGSQVKVKAVGQTMVLYGLSYGKGSAERVVNFARIYHNNVVNLINEKEIAVEPRKDKMIQVHAHFLEVKKHALKALGFKWTPLGNASMAGMTEKHRSREDGVVSEGISSVGQITGFFTNLLPKFSNARDRSMGRQLKVSSISVRSGERATFQSGGELGFPVATGNGAISLQFKKYGMLLDILPIAQGENITLKIKVRVNYPTNLGSANAGSSIGYINFTLSELETVQYCKSGNSIALAGLLDNVDRKAFDGSPGNGDALFELFRSSEFQKDQSELIVMITPEIVGQAKDANIEMKQQVSRSFDAYEPLAR